MMNEHKIIEAITEEHPDVEAIYLYGSRAGNDYSSQSDYDLALVLPHGMVLPDKWKTMSDLSLALRADVDLVHLNTANTVLQYEIIMTGTRLYAKDDVRSDFFENNVMAMYFTLNEDRKQIPESIVHNGTAHE